MDHKIAAHLAGSIAEAVVLASTLPLGVGGGAMRIARAGLTLVLVPVFLAADPHRPVGLMLTEVLRGALIGGALGLSAMVIFGAVVGAGSAIDAALMWAPVADRAGSGSPIGFLYQAGFAAVLFSAGGFTAIVVAAAKASAQLPVDLVTLKGAAVLGRVCLTHSAVLAGPALLAQMIASLLAGLAARAAPQAGSILMSAPLILAAVLLVLIAGSGALFVRFADLIRDLLALIRG